MDTPERSLMDGGQVPPMGKDAAPMRLRGRKTPMVIPLPRLAPLIFIFCPKYFEGK